jgi:hypothetical protein
MKKLITFLLIAISFTSFAQKGKDKEAPVITYISIPDGYVIEYGQTVLSQIYLDATDNVGIYQKVYQIDPCGPTYPAGPQQGKNCSVWSATDFWEVNKFQADISALEPGPHVLRYTVYDRARNETTKEITFYIVEP